MSRSLWFAAGAGAGVYAVHRVRRVAEAFTWDGLRDRAHGAAASARIFADEVAAGRAEKESDLRQRLGLVPHGVPELTPGRNAGLADPRLIDPRHIDPRLIDPEGTS